MKCDICKNNGNCAFTGGESMCNYVEINRHEANTAIINLLKKTADENPDLRFHQILQNLSAVIAGSDQWYEESITTLSRIVDSIQH